MIKSKHWMTERWNWALPQNFCVFHPFLPQPESKEHRGWGATGLHSTIFSPWWLQISSDLPRAEGATHSSRIRIRRGFHTHPGLPKSSFGWLSWNPRSEQDALHFKHSLDLNHYLFEWMNKYKNRKFWIENRLLQKPRNSQSFPLTHTFETVKNSALEPVRS